MCNDGWIPCLVELLPNGCPEAGLGNICVQPEFGNDGEPCPAWCPELGCGEGPVCAGERDPNGCRIAPDFCCPLA